MQNPKKRCETYLLTKVLPAVCALGMILLLGSCSSSTDSVSEQVTLVFQVNTTVSPAEGGAVSPASSLVEIGTNLSVEASPNTGWAFEGWSGSVESQQNPLSVQINNNMDLTANFRQIESIYRVSLSLSDDSGSLEELGFGQLKDPNSVGVPDAPPPPPSGVLTGWFERNGQRLFMDFRDSLQRSASWHMHVELGSGDLLNLSWQIDSELLEGSLRLFGPDGTELVDMLQESTSQVTLPSGKGVLTFKYELE